MHSTSDRAAIAAGEKSSLAQDEAGMPRGVERATNLGMKNK